METVLKIDNVSKSFGNKKVLKGVSLELNKGDILAFIGPNGSGKTTTIKMALGLQSIDDGNIYISGHDIKKDFEKAIGKVGAIVESPDSYMYLSGYKNLKLLANLYNGVTNEKINNLLEIVDLKDRKKDKVSKYSLGMRQRLGIAKALINDPDVLILVEPTNGLDPEGIRDLRNLLKKLAKDGLAILISSHNLSELESFCNKVCILNNGETSKIESIDKIKKDTNKYIFNVNSVAKIEYKGIVRKSDNGFIFEGNKEDVSKLVEYLVSKHIQVYEIRKVEISLEDAFLNITGGKHDKTN